MIIKLLTEHYLEFLSLKRGCRGSSKSTHIKMPHCWKSHATAQIDSLGVISHCEPVTTHDTQLRKGLKSIKVDYVYTETVKYITEILMNIQRNDHNLRSAPYFFRTRKRR